MTPDRITYRCPACGSQTLIIDSIGHFVCSWLKCTDPCAFSDLIDKAVAALGVSGSPQRQVGNECDYLHKTCVQAWPQDPASWCDGCQAEHWHDRQDDDDPRTVEEIVGADPPARSRQTEPRQDEEGDHARVDTMGDPKDSRTASTD